VFGTRIRAARRQEFVATYKLPGGIGRELRGELGDAADLGIAFRGLHQWLRIHVAAPRTMLTMPSKAVDLLWHEFILHTTEYEEFCQHAYGRTLHHVPETSMNAETHDTLNDEAMGRTYAMACADGGIRLPLMVGLPVLFQVDTELAVPNGQQWSLDCGHYECTALPPAHCVRHQVRPFIPDHLPLQRDPRTGRWILPKHWEFSLGGGSVGDIAAGAGYTGGPACGGHG
jgi:hypothetical protein